MSIKNPDQQEPYSVQPPKIEIDLSQAWDAVSTGEMFVDGLRRAGIYKGNLYFSGFDGSREAKTAGKVYCADESALTSGASHPTAQNPLENFAVKYEKPCIAIYDGEKMENTNDYQFNISDPSALIAVIILRL